jgi:glycosyltransferase involved in cell wall biosynthesis
MNATVKSDFDIRPRRGLAGATVLQIVPTLQPNRTAHVAVNVAQALVRIGARAIIAGEDGPLVETVKSFGGEWVYYPDTTFNFFKLKSNVELLARLVKREGIDIVHAKGVGAAWSALPAVAHAGANLVTELPDLSPAQLMLGGTYLRAVSSGDRIIAPSAFEAKPIIERYRVPRERIKVIPRGIDIASFDPARINPARVVALRQTWGVPSGAHVVLAPGSIALWNGQATLVEAARILLETGVRSVTFVLAGDDRRHRRHVRALVRLAQANGVYPLFRIIGECQDMPTALAAADIVVIPWIKPPVSGRAVAEAQAMARPVITSTAGPLGEYLLAPPQVPDDLRTGWAVPPGAAHELARALGEALALDVDAYRKLSARARQFAAYMFSPESVVTATLEVYISLLQAATYADVTNI